MRTLELIAIFLINVLSSRKFLLEVENVNRTKSGTDYTIDPGGELNLLNTKQRLGGLLLRTALVLDCKLVSSNNYQDYQYFPWSPASTRFTFEGELDLRFPNNYF